MSPTPSITKEGTHICHYPPTAPHRRLYLFTRTLSIILALIQIGTAATVAGAFKQVHWLDPSLTPAITTLLYSSVDIVCILRWDRRSHHLTRSVYDGALAVGFAVAAGFLARLAVPFMRGKEGGVVVGALGVVVLACMLLQVIIHFGVCVGGVQETVEIRHERQQQENGDNANRKV
ncbi:hypothetical protein B0T25DRAFT_580136 [Lasiosphaeria hispida]|uniref:Uncharacterized protein n=1 Tax=Lasiosphaeria hispida TaxID=260671 RepID=A0AAJ0HNN6_9PEZI|nr:hypothetical protein B0T25DRAFT_580136 [Lasiosphaeria hispida]